MQQSHTLFTIAKLLVNVTVAGHGMFGHVKSMENKLEVGSVDNPTI